MTVEAPSLAADAYGGQTETYSTLGSYFCVLQPHTGRDQFKFEVSEPKLLHKATIRWIDDLKDIATIQKYRFTIDGRYWRPLLVKNLDHTRKMYGHQYLEITLEDNGAINE